MEKLLQVGRDLGGLGLAAAALLVALALFHALVLGPLQARSAQLADAASRQAPQAAAGTPAGAAANAAAVYEFLRKEEQPTDWLAKLHGIGAATGVQMRSATYRSVPAEGRIQRYEIVLPLAGSYPQIRDFMRRALEEITVLSVDQVTLKRENRNEGALQGELRLTLHMVKA